MKNNLFRYKYSMKWPVMPLCEKQLRDVNPSDILEDGLYRKYDTCKGGGGYDQFNAIAEKRIPEYQLMSQQFVVQLYGCTMACPYCYVTEDGIFGEPTMRSTKQLIAAYNATGLDVFHLMGGAPAIYMAKWPEISSKVKVFHSDFILNEEEYDPQILRDIKGLHAVSIKEHTKASPKVMDNIDTLLESPVQFYFTFTGECLEWKKRIEDTWGTKALADSFTIPIMHYKALEDVDASK